MNKVIIKADFEEALNCEIYTREKVEVIIDVEIPKSLTPVPKDTIRFFVTTEPPGDYNDIIRNNQDCFSYLLTSFPDLLKEIDNSVLFNGPTPFVEPDLNIKKKFAVSSILSGRMGFPGHILRRELYEKRSQIKIPFDFYLASRNKLPEWFYTPDSLICPPEKKDKKVMFDCMFHVAIDSYKRDNYFSEKLIDCFLTKTVPIYWGCPNIKDYFYESGILHVDTVEDIIWFCNELGEHDYRMFRDVIDRNYMAAMQWNYQFQLETTIKMILRGERTIKRILRCERWK